MCLWSARPQPGTQKPHDIPSSQSLGRRLDCHKLAALLQLATPRKDDPDRYRAHDLGLLNRSALAAHVRVVRVCRHGSAHPWTRPSKAHVRDESDRSRSVYSRSMPSVPTSFATLLPVFARNLETEPHDRTMPSLSGTLAAGREMARSA